LFVKEPTIEADDAFVSGDGRTSQGCTVEGSSHRLWCMSVMAVQEKCDEKRGSTFVRLRERCDAWPGVLSAIACLRQLRLKRMASQPGA